MLAQRLRTLREARGWTQTVLAQRAGVSLTAVSFLETCRITDPHVSTVVALARALGCTLDTLVGWEADVAVWTREVPGWVKRYEYETV